MSGCNYRCLTPDGAQCELPAGHQEPHRNGLLIWHDPPLLLVNGEPVPPLTERELDLLRHVGELYVPSERDA